jgi:membrane-bound lytic murein transglycosylase B
MKRSLLRAGPLALLALYLPASAAAAGLDVARDDVRVFISSLAQQHGLDATHITALLRDAVPQPGILELIARPAERTLAWWEYRPRFLNEDRINGGVKVWQTHRDELARIAARTGVPAEYLVAITGVETFYGRITGRYRVLDALTTLGFNYPPRGDFFRRELAQFLVMAGEEGLDPRMPLGSYAGAMGIAQFMPSSVRSFAVDDANDGRRDLWAYGPDVFGSIANYFVEHGWRTGQPVLTEANHAAAPDDPARLKLTLGDTIDSLRTRGYVFESALPGSAPAMLVPAMLETGLTWRVGYQNFHVITRYNRSMMYGMAVHELAQAIASRYHAASLLAQGK